MTSDMETQAASADLNMLVMTGGRERTVKEFEALFTRAGFKMTRVVPTKSPFSLLEARPA